MPPRWPHNSAARAFSLIELMVVIAIIVTLLAILGGALGAARSVAGRAVCASNLRQWAMGVNLYAQTNDNWLPRRGQGTQPTQQIGFYDDWFNELPPLLNAPTYQQLAAAGTPPAPGSHSLWICPELTGTPNVYGHLFGYAMNMALSVRNAPLPDRLDRVGPLDTMVFMADGDPGYCSTIPNLSTPAAPTDYNPVPRHDNKVNIAFLDAHVDAFTASYVGCGVDDPKRPDIRWYWYVPGPFPAPWPGP